MKNKSRLNKLKLRLRSKRLIGLLPKSRLRKKK